MFKKKSKPQTAFIDEVGEKLHLVGDAVREGSAQAIEASGPYLERANEWLNEASEAAAPRLREASARLHEVAESVRPHVEGAVDDVRSRLSEGRSRLEEGYRSEVAPKLESGAAEARARAHSVAERAGESVSKAAGVLAAAETSKGFDDTVARLTGDKKAVKKARKALKKAGKDVKAKTSSNGKSSGKWFWIILGLAGLGGIVFYAVRRLAPVEDPWSTPLPANRPADARPVGSTPRSEQADGPVASVSSEVPAPEDAAVEDEGDTEGTEGAGTDR
ncbi:hypothetical protein [Brevibacterium album]|uniref:hypothetical protein n=1 Tax=Brevibacterium album TaxID=417948 RepID=UPI000408035E|nr:hypothetical protein [Brevibacterium album]